MIVSILAAIFWVTVTYGRLNPNVIGVVLMIVLGECLFTKHSHHHHRGVLMVETLANQSNLRQVQPTYKLIMTVLLIFVLIGSQNEWASCFVGITSLVFMKFIQKLDYHQIKDLLSTPLIFIFVSTLGIAISITLTPAEMSLHLGKIYLSVSEMSQIQGLRLALVSSASVSLLLNFAISTPMGDIILALKQLRTPKILIEIMYFIYRYIITLSTLLGNMQNSAQSRLGFVNQKRTYRTSLWIASRLFHQSLRLSLESLSAMESRLYQGELKFIGRDYHAEKYRLIMIGYTVLVIITCCIGGIML